MNGRIFMAAVFLFLALNTACGSTVRTAPTQAGSDAVPVTTDTAAPVKSATSIPSGSVPSSGGLPAGSFTPNHPVHTKTLVLNADGTYQNLGIVEAGKTAAIPIGTYTVSGDHVTFVDAPGAASVCQKDQGEYTWSFDGTNLVFKVVNDECSERKIDLTNSTWTKQP